MIRLPLAIQKIFKGVTWQEQTSQNEVFVTFDDGPIPEVTPWVLDEAEKWNAKLTFFCVGENAYKHPDVLQEVIKRGHKIGNHTYNHLRGWKEKREDYFKNIQKAAEVLETNLFRPPHGQLYPSYIKALTQEGYKTVMWSILSCDYNRRLSGEKVFNNVKRYLAPGAVIVFHDSLKAEKNMKYAFPKTMELISSMNMKAISIK